MSESVGEMDGSSGVGQPPSVSLEITVAPRDLRYLEQTLPHQLRRWGDQVEEIFCTVDLEPTPGRPGDDSAQEAALLGCLERCLSPYSHARIEVADYSPRTASAVAEMFFGGDRVPAKTFRGGPFYAYFFGLYRARNDYVLHLDSDMLFGGGSRAWTEEAVGLLRREDDVLLAGPLPGPPRPDGTIMQAGTLEPRVQLGYSFSTVTTRVFLVDRRRLLGRIGRLEIRRHPPVQTRVPLRVWLREASRLRTGGSLRPLVVSTPPYELPERLLGEAMARNGLRRISFLGRPPGMWSLHPVDRSERFYASLSRLIERVERGDVSIEQRGYYDVVDSMLD